MNKDLIIANLATIPQRLDLVESVINQILPQVDILNIVLNKYKTIPHELVHRLKDEKINITLDSDDRWGERGKFLYLGKFQGYYLTIDDDIVYPSDYVEKMIGFIEHHNRRAICCVHANIIQKPFVNFFKSRECFLFRDALPAEKVIDIPGTGTTAFHTSCIRLQVKDFRAASMSDIWLGYYAKKQHVPCIAVSRGSGWLKPVFRKGIYESSLGDRELQLIQAAVIQEMLVL